MHMQRIPRIHIPHPPHAQTLVAHDAANQVTVRVAELSTTTRLDYCLTLQGFNYCRVPAALGGCLPVYALLPWGVATQQQRKSLPCVVLATPGKCWVVYFLPSANTKVEKRLRHTEHGRVGVPIGGYSSTRSAPARAYAVMIPDEAIKRLRSLEHLVSID